MQKNRIAKVIPLIIFSLILFAGCKKEVQQAQRTETPAIVELMTVEQKDTPFVVEYVGITEGSKSVEVKAQVGGILRERLYQEGQYVNAGDVLFTIEPDTYEAALKAAKPSIVPS